VNIEIRGDRDLNRVGGPLVKTALRTIILNCLLTTSTMYSLQAVSCMVEVVQLDSSTSSFAQNARGDYKL
jgi:hypothetical protein